MRILVASLFLLISLAPDIFSQQSFFQDASISCQFVNTPNNSADNVAGLPVSRPDWWLEIDVKYKTVDKSSGKGNNKIAEWMDDVTFEYDVLILGTTKPVFLSGKVTYWSIPLDGKEHHAVAFVHPRFLQRYAPGIKTTQSFAREISMRVKFTLNSALVGGAFHPDKKAKDVAALFGKAATDPNIIRVQDSVYGKDKTPWNYLNYDYYELIKTDSRR